MQLGIHSGDLWVLFGAVLFGVFYNGFIDWTQTNGYSEGYVSFLVAGGVVVTLILSAFIVGIEAVIVVGIVFAASGLPMIVGSVRRYVINRRREVERE